VRRYTGNICLRYDGPKALYVSPADMGNTIIIKGGISISAKDGVIRCNGGNGYAQNTHIVTEMVLGTIFDLA
jgi:hypothetical protein